MKAFFKKYFGKGKLFGISKLDIEIIHHFKKHGKMINAEVLVHCPICNKDHKVLFFNCKCGDRFFLHLNNAANQFKVGLQNKKTWLFE